MTRKTTQGIEGVGRRNMAAKLANSTSAECPSHARKANQLPVVIKMVVTAPTYAGSVAGQALPIESMPRIEAVIHQAAISGIDTDEAGRWAVTASNDKTACAGEAASGRLMQNLRPPIGPGDRGWLDAAAISPDGAPVAVGGGKDSLASCHGERLE